MRSLLGRPSGGSDIGVLSDQLARSARTKAASAAGSDPRTTTPSGKLTLNFVGVVTSGAGGIEAAGCTSTNRGFTDTGDAAGASVLAFASRRDRCTQCANVVAFKPARLANSACVSPLPSYSFTTSALRSRVIRRRPRRSLGCSSPITTSVSAVFITRDYQRRSHTPTRHPAGRLP